MKNYKVLNFKAHGDERGFLVPLEASGDIPFDIKRIFYIYGTTGKGIVRGKHANKFSSFVLVALAGSCKVNFYDNNGNFETVILDSPEKGVYFPNMTWKEMVDFAPETVLLCITDKHFNADEYIDTYEEYLKELQK